MHNIKTISKGISKLKENHESHIKKIEDNLNNLQDRVRVVVVVRKIAMDNPTKGLMKLNEHVEV